MSDEWENGVSPAKMAKVRRDMEKFCFCGKLRIRHSIAEANTCKKSMKTDTVGKVMTKEDIANAEFRRI